MKRKPNTLHHLTDVNRKPKKTKNGGRKKAEKHVVLPVHKRPVICPPDRAGRSPVFRLLGYLCRVLLVTVATASLVIFLSSALEYGVAPLTIISASLCTVLPLSLLLYNRVARIAGLACIGGLLIWQITTRPSLFSDLYYGILSLYNGALERLYNVGYLTYIRYQVPIHSSSPSEDLLPIGVCLLCVLIGTIFTLCLVQHVRIGVPALLATSLLVVVLTFNIYSNRITSNLGIALVIIAFASVMIMSAYDRIYRNRKNDQYDNELKLFEDSDRPALPEAYVTEQQIRAERKRTKKALRKKNRKKTRTVSDELDAYFGTKPAQKTVPKEKLSPAERKRRKGEHRAMMKQVRLVRNHDRITEQSRAAMGGFAGMAALLLVTLTVLLPATLIRGNFSTIDAIDEKLSYARDYVTAVLRGDDERLDELEYQADEDNFEPHSTDLEQLEFDGTQIFYLQSRYNTNYYLRGWIGVNYVDGAWQAVNDQTLDDYRSLFSTSDSPAEEMRYSFYHYMSPSLVDDPAYNGENYLQKYHAHLDHGFVNTLVSLRRVNSPSTLCYFPSYFDSGKGIFSYNSLDENDLTYVNFFDGIYTGRSFDDNDVAQATVTYTPVMTGDSWAENLAALEAAYNLQKEALLAMTGYTVKEDGRIDSDLTLSLSEQVNGMTTFTYTLKKGNGETIWRFYHDTDSITRENGNYIITTDTGTLTILMNVSRVVGVEITNPYLAEGDYDLLTAYRSYMTDEERTILTEFISTDRTYSNFVYRTYTQKSGSAYISALAREIAANAHTEKLVPETVTVPDDPETEEDESITYIKEDLTNFSADVSLAALRNTSSAETYIQRNLLVRNVIDYIIDEMGCTYAITPDLTNVDETLDGVENFLRNTKQGYCVQFASAAALLLRELDIPVRYVEGYIATGLDRLKGESNSDFIYGGYVIDECAHAWIEVYFDGVGWVQYETTPRYYTDMYGAKGTGSTIVAPDAPPHEETKPPDNPHPLLPEETLPEDTETDASTEHDNSDAIMKGGLIALVVIAAIVAIACIVGSVVSRARRAEDIRQSTVSQVLESGFGVHVSDEDRKEMALSITDAIHILLKLYNLAPRPGEFRDEYADRLTVEFMPSANDQKSSAETAPSLPDLHRVLNAMAAEEFGHGMSVEDMKLLASFYLYLRRDLKRRIPFAVRLRLRYVKRLI